MRTFTFVAPSIEGGDTLLREAAECVSEMGVNNWGLGNKKSPPSFLIADVFVLIHFFWGTVKYHSDGNSSFS